MKLNKHKSIKITTGRLVLRLTQVKLAKAILNYYLENKDHFSSTEAFRPKEFYTLNYWKKQIPKFEKEFKQDQSVRFLLFQVGNPSKVIGTINFTQIFRGPFQACYLGYAISHGEQGKGLMTEALQAAIQYIFDESNVHRIMANYLPSNVASERVLKKLGFAIEGRADKYLFINGEWREHVLTSLTNDLWRQV